MKKTKLAILLSSLFFVSELSYADMIIEGNVANVGNGISDKQPDAEGYYHFGDMYVGPGSKGILTVNQGTKLKTGEIHVGNHSTGDGTLIVDGAGTRIEIIGNRLNVGGSGSKGKLYIRNGAVLVQSNARSDDNYFGYHGGEALIEVEGESSKLILNLGRLVIRPEDQYGIRTNNSKIYLKDGGTMEINDFAPLFALPYVENNGSLIAQKALRVKELYIGNDQRGGYFNFGGGLSVFNKVVINKLTEETATLPLNTCDYRCSIIHNADESLVLLKNGSRGISPALLEINKGKVIIDDQNTFDTFKAEALNLKPNATFSLTNIGKTDPAAVGATDVKAKNFEHLGILDLADGTNSPKFTEFTVENYKGGGLLLVDSVWNKDTQTSATDTLHIKGNINPDGITTVKTKNGIWGDITQTTEDQFLSLPVVKVASEHANNLFVGKSPTQNGGEAQLLKIGNDYYWSLKARLPAPVVPNKPEVTPDNPPVVPNKPEVKPNNPPVTPNTPEVKPN
ncbi:hypothetical protein ACT2CV_09670, partial [Pasteurellaceae bacterium 22721_9_1]